MQLLFGGYSLDLDRRELRNDSDLVAMEPQVFDVLVHLVQNRDRVVTKDDLFAAVWHGRIVSESTLTSRINAARKAVGDSGEQQALIRTIARKGFRFVGAISDQLGPGSAATATIARAKSPANHLRQEIHFCTATDGVRIAYAAVGQGPPLIKTANWLNHLEYDWESPIWSHLLDEIAATYRLIR
jgi:DNA-binding winged helix-turn-helix (wHTH) protein